ncbi:hypothetical protein ACFOEX_08750, partial [Camelimonas abortus]
MSEPVMPPVNARTVARIGLALAVLVLIAIIALTFGPFRDRSAPAAAGGAPAAAGTRPPVQQARPVQKTEPAGEAQPAQDAAGRAPG